MIRPAATTLGFVLAAGMTLGGCDSVRSVFSWRGGAERSAAADFDQAAAPASQAGDPTPAAGEREVEFPVVAQSVADSLFPDGDEKFAATVVPVLAPASMSAEEATGFIDSFRSTPDGYFARLAAPGFDAVVNGTRAYAVAPASAGAPPARDMSQVQYSETDTGASVTFNRFGADYSIEFTCRGAGDAGGSCVSEAQAAEFVERLVPVGGGGR